MTRPDTTPGWNAQRRAALYHVLLREWGRSEYGAFIGHSDDLDDPVLVCELCFATARDLDHLKHSAHCLLTRTRAALDAERRGDNEAIRKMLEEMGQ